MIQAIKRFFSSLLRGLWGFLKTVISGAVEVAIAQLKDFAIETVKNLAEQDLSNEERRRKAFEIIRGNAITRGITVRDSVVNLIIELAVQWIKKGVEK